MKIFDVAVLGVGGMGSAACWQLAKAGKRVLGIEQFSIPNTRGSSHGATRILRLGLHESEKYVPLVLRSVELWQETGKLAGLELFHQVGSLDVAPLESPVFRGSLRACETCDIDHDVLDAKEIRRRFPALNPLESMKAVHQPGSGFVLPEVAISTQANLAMAAGAEIHGHERVEGWERTAFGFRIRTDRDEYEVGQILVTGGAWIGKLFPRLPVTAERVVLGWFAPIRDGGNFLPDKLPVWIVDSEETGHYYGFPIHGVPGFKLGRLRENPSAPVDPDMPRREAGREDEEDMRGFVRQIFPDADGPILAMETCFFENTPDRDPIIDEVEDGVWVIGGFSGHGFKYASVMGEIAAELLTRGESRFSLAAFRASRFAA